MKLKSRIEEQRSKMNNVYSTELHRCIMNVIDLIAEDTTYHRKSYQQFSKRKGESTEVGQPIKDEVYSTMQKIFQEVENSKDCRFSVNNLPDKTGRQVQEKKNKIT